MSNSISGFSHFRFKTSIYERVINAFQKCSIFARFLNIFKGSPDQSHFIFELNVGQRRIRHTTTLNLNLQSISSWSRNSSFYFRVVVCRIRLFPTSISKIKWLGSELPLRTLWLVIRKFDFFFGICSCVQISGNCDNFWGFLAWKLIEFMEPLNPCTSLNLFIWLWKYSEMGKIKRMAPN